MPEGRVRDAVEGRVDRARGALDQNAVEVRLRVVVGLDHFDAARRTQAQLAIDYPDRRVELSTVPGDGDRVAVGGGEDDRVRLGPVDGDVGGDEGDRGRGGFDGHGFLVGLAEGVGCPHADGIGGGRGGHERAVRHDDVAARERETPAGVVEKGPGDRVTESDVGIDRRERADQRAGLGGGADLGIGQRDVARRVVEHVGDGEGAVGEREGLHAGHVVGAIGAARAGVDDGVGRGRGSIGGDGVVAPRAGEHHRVVARAAVDGVVAGGALEEVVAAITDERVGAAAAPHRLDVLNLIGNTPGDGHRRRRRTVQSDRHRAGLGGIVDRVDTGAAIDDVRLGRSGDAVVTARTGEPDDVLAIGPGDRKGADRPLREGPAGGAEVAVAGGELHGDRLDVGRAVVGARQLEVVGEERVAAPVLTELIRREDQIAGHVHAGHRIPGQLLEAAEGDPAEVVVRVGGDGGADAVQAGHHRGTDLQGVRPGAAVEEVAGIGVGLELKIEEVVRGTGEGVGIDGARGGIFGHSTSPVLEPEAPDFLWFSLPTERSVPLNSLPCPIRRRSIAPRASARDRVGGGLRSGGRCGMALPQNFSVRRVLKERPGASTGWP